MSRSTLTGLLGAGILSAAALAFAAPAHAQAQGQPNVMRACGAEWQAAKAAGKVKDGDTWSAFLAECRSRKAAAPSSAPSEPAPARRTAASGKAVFPAKVNPAHASLRPSQQRIKTCSEQYQANKATNSNGGLNWLQKGGGYWSECNKKLKGAA